MVQISTLLLGFFATVAFGFNPTSILPSSRLLRQASASNNRYPYHSLAIRAAIAHNPLPDLDEDVQVYDGTFSPVACQVIHGLALVHSMASNSDTCIFLRPPFNQTALTPLEHAMDSALNALNDTSGNIVEYWARDEHMNIDAHVDIDENALEEEGAIRYPEVAHILYLEVKKGLVGPTVVFPGKRIGWGVDQNIDTAVDVVTIPAVQGRILRFPGSSMHTVPCPVDRWLLTDEEEYTLRYEEDHEDEDDDYEDDEDEDEEYEEDDDDDDKYEEDDEEDEQVERSVLLFNTWSSEGPPPRDVKTGFATAVSQYEGGEQGLIEEWEEDYGVDAEWIRCNPASEWRRTKIQREGKDNPLSEVSQEVNDDGVTKTGQHARVHLMGEQNRRLYEEKLARFHVPEKQVLQDALHQEVKVTRLRLMEKR
jgi:hypothetical protein